MSEGSLTGAPNRTLRHRGTQLARRLGKTILRRNRRIDALVTERQNLRIAKGILQLEKGGLEAVVRDLTDQIINPPAPHPPTNPTGYIPSAVPFTGQAYREYLTRQIYWGTTTPTVDGVTDADEFLNVGNGWRGAGKFGPNWIAVDQFDPSPVVGSRYDVQSLPAEWTDRFALAVCNAVLEHIPYPQKAVDELARVLAPGGYVYLEVAFWQPYHTDGDSPESEKYRSGGDLWRATVEGVRIWTAAFDEISCGWANEGVVYYFGRRAMPPESRTGRV